MRPFWGVWVWGRGYIGGRVIRGLQGLLGAFLGPLSGGTSWAVIVLVGVFAAFPADQDASPSGCWQRSRGAFCAPCLVRCLAQVGVVKGALQGCPGAALQTGHSTFRGPVMMSLWGRWSWRWCSCVGLPLPGLLLGTPDVPAHLGVVLGRVVAAGAVPSSWSLVVFGTGAVLGAQGHHGLGAPLLGGW